MNVVVPLLLLAPLVLVPLGFRLLAVATPGSEPPTLLRMAAIPAAVVLALAFTMPQGAVAAALAVPWLAVTGLVALAAGLRFLRDPDRLRLGPRYATDAAVAFLAIGASFALIDRLGARPLGFASEVILLTAVHFHFAGFVLPLAGALAFARRPRRWLALALGLVVIGIPTTAVGFFGLPAVNWAGSMLVATGGLGIGLGTLTAARGMTSPAARLLALLAGASLLAAMPLAAAYATGTLIGSAWLDLPTMARIHGGLNALGFALLVMLAWTLDRRAQAGAPR
jgi:YndJ-like protein